MSKKFQICLVLCSIVFIVIGLGCLPLSYYMTPGKLDKGAVGYTIDAGVAEPNDYDGFQNLAKVLILEKNVDAAYKVTQQKINHMAEKNDLLYSLYSKSVAADKERGLKTEEFLFGSTGLVSFGLTTAGLSSLAGLLGLMRKRPGDITREEYQQTLAEVQGKSISELSEKEKQFVELIKSLEDFKKCVSVSDLPSTDIITVLDSLKVSCNAQQDTNTQVAVAAVKKTI